MKNLILIILLPLLGFKADEQISWLNGAYQMASTPKKLTSNISSKNFKTIRLFYGGHWAKFEYNDQLVKLEGGVFNLDAGKHSLKSNYFLDDLSSKGKIEKYDFSIQDGPNQPKGSLRLTGEVEQEEEFYNKIQSQVPLQHKYLEGVWQLNGFALNGNAKPDNRAGIACLKYYLYPIFLLVKYSADGRVIGFAKGEYNFDYNKASVTEKVGISTLPEYNAGQVITASVVLHDNSFERNPLRSAPKEFWISATAK
ncbi:hypothetical protein BH23BAC1_BH23BAC1_44860 [soil metagenome]